MTIPDDNTKAKEWLKDRKQAKQFLVELFSDDSILMNLMKSNDPKLSKHKERSQKDLLKKLDRENMTFNSSIIDILLKDIFDNEDCVGFLNQNL